MAESYGVSPSSMGKINRWWQARKAAGQSVQPWELESMYEGEMNALQNNRTASRGLSLQQKSLDQQAARDAENIALQKRASDLQAARDAENARMNNVNTQFRQDEIALRQNEIDSSEKGQMTGALSNIGTTALMSYLLKSKNPSSVAPGAGAGATNTSGIIPGSAEATSLPGNTPAGTFDTSMKGWNPLKNTGDPVNTTISEPIVSEGFAGSPAYQASENYIDPSLLSQNTNTTASQVGSAIDVGEAGGFGGGGGTALAGEGAFPAASIDLAGGGAGEAATFGMGGSGASGAGATGAGASGAGSMSGASLGPVTAAITAAMMAKSGLSKYARGGEDEAGGLKGYVANAAQTPVSSVLTPGQAFVDAGWIDEDTAVGKVLGLPGKLERAIMDPVAEVLGTVICTELHRQGLISDDILKYDSLFRARYISDAEYLGYRILAAPVVWLLRKSAIFTRFFAPLAVATATEMASRANVTINGTMDGKVVLAFMVPLCGYVGRFIRYFGYPLSIFPKVKEV